MFPLTEIEPVPLDVKPWTNALVEAFTNTLKLSIHVSLKEVFDDIEPGELPDYLSLNPQEIPPRDLLKIASREFSIFVVFLDKTGKSMLEHASININLHSLYQFVPKEAKIRLPCLGYPGPLLSKEETIRYIGTTHLKSGERAVRWLREHVKEVETTPSIPAPIGVNTTAKEIATRLAEPWLTDLEEVNMDNEVLFSGLALVPAQEAKLHRTFTSIQKETEKTIDTTKFFADLKTHMKSGSKHAAFYLKSMRAGLTKAATKFDTVSSFYECVPCVSPVVKGHLDWTELDLAYNECDMEKKKDNIHKRVFFMRNVDKLHSVNLKIRTIAMEVAEQIFKEEKEKVAEHDAQIIALHDQRNKLVHEFNNVYRPMLQAALKSLSDLYFDSDVTPSPRNLKLFFENTYFRGDVPYKPRFLVPSLKMDDIAELEACFFKGMKVAASDYFKLYFLMLK